MLKKNCAYVDGSFNPEKFLCGYGGILYDQKGEKHSFKGVEAAPEVVKMRNVGGEIAAAMKAVELAIDLGMTTLTIFYDYYGVEKWATGEWIAKKKPTKFYANFMKKILVSSFKLYFSHITSHTGHPGNDEADSLAKSAVKLGRLK